jgi:hypothetical protein
MMVDPWLYCSEELDSDTNRADMWVGRFDLTNYWSPWIGDTNMETFVEIDPKQGLKLTEEHYLLMPPQIVGFTLGTRRWGKLFR